MQNSRQIGAMLRSVPDAATDVLGVECRLGVDAHALDVSIALNPHGCAWLVESRRWPEAAEIVARAPVGASDAPMPWIEFDTGRRLDPNDRPNLFVGIATAGHDAADLLTFVRNVAADRSVGDSHVERCLSVMPDSVHRIYVGVMARAGAPTMRLHFDAFGRDALVRFLHEIGWTGFPEEVGALLDRFTSSTGRYRAHVDLHAHGIAPRIGIEFVRSWPTHADAPDDVLLLLDELVAEKLCTEAERALFASWPTSLSRAFGLRYLLSRMYGSSPERDSDAFTRVMHHVKLSFSPTEAVAAKLYLALCRDRA